jgi:alpha-beta hydrolase superfamily lysophospholipase
MPRFRALRRLWLDQGGVWVVANIRGGGEYGDSWHTGGNLAKNQNGFDDFYACAQHLVGRGYTNPERLAIMGGSNGGLLTGAALTQHPDAYRAVVSFVGLDLFKALSPAPGRRPGRRPQRRRRAERRRRRTFARDRGDGKRRPTPRGALRPRGGATTPGSRRTGDA